MKNFFTKVLTNSNLGLARMHDRYITVPKSQVDPEKFLGTPPFDFECTDLNSGKVYTFPFNLEGNGEFRLTQFGQFFNDNNAQVGDIVYVEKRTDALGETLYFISLVYGKFSTEIRNTFLNHDEIVPKTNQLYQEGSKKTIMVNRYERNTQARQECIDYYGAECAVCEFDFEEKYGEIGDGYIHVHHVVPVSRIGESYTVDPVTDLIPVCPNCHAMIHKKTPPYTVGELKDLIS